VICNSPSRNAGPLSITTRTAALAASALTAASEATSLDSRPGRTGATAWRTRRADRNRGRRRRRRAPRRGGACTQRRSRCSPPKHISRRQIDTAADATRAAHLCYGLTAGSRTRVHSVQCVLQARSTAARSVGRALPRLVNWRKDSPFAMPRGPPHRVICWRTCRSPTTRRPSSSPRSRGQCRRGERGGCAVVIDSGPGVSTLCELQITGVERYAASAGTPLQHRSNPGGQATTSWNCLNFSASCSRHRIFRRCGGGRIRIRRRPRRHRSSRN